MKLAYRPEIDGLRAIAVLAVVAYHAKLGGAGFIGVDVFFVISGYLITSLLLREQAETGRIDLLAFYARRVRRIFPAAIVVVIAVLAASGILLTAEAVADVAASAGASAVFGANFYFQSVTGGYWSADSEQMPLLHLWSLAVEEQFYLFWPALLIFIPRMRVRASLVALAIASLCLAEWLVRTHPTAAFYQMPSRFWELAAGGLIATLPSRAVPRWLFPGGIVVVLAACVFATPTFPGVGALPAALGAAAVILATHSGQTNAFLRSRVMVGVGLISYSLYLWHWPLLVFYRNAVIDPDPQIVFLVCIAAVVLAALSYRFVERPVRRMRWPSRRMVFAGAAAMTLLAATACAVDYQARRYAAAHADNPAAVFASQDVPDQACHEATMDAAKVRCSIGERVVWGDSVAWSWSPAFPGSIATRDACPPAVGFLVQTERYNPRGCVRFNDAVLREAADAKVVVLSANWRQYPGFDLSKTLDALTGQVLIIGPTPEMKLRVPDCIRRHAETECGESRAEFDAEAKPILARLREQTAGHPNARVIDMTDQFCTATTCPPVMNGVALYWDKHHITTTAARRFKP